jgi:hypothetical protein
MPCLIKILRPTLIVLFATDAFASLMHGPDLNGVYVGCPRDQGLGHRAFDECGHARSESQLDGSDELRRGFGHAQGGEAANNEGGSLHSILQLAMTA